MAHQADWQLTESNEAEELAFDFTGTLDGNVIAGRAIQGNKGLAVRSIRIDAPDPAGISAQFLRKLPLGEVLATARNALSQHIDYNAPEPEPQPRGCTCGCHPARRPQSDRYATLDDAFLRRVALGYIEEAAAGPGALGRLTTRFDRPEGTVRTWIKLARREGWLAPGRQGRLAAEPGPKLLTATPRSA